MGAKRIDLDEFLWLVEGGEYPPRAAARCGGQLESVARVARRRGRLDIAVIADGAVAIERRYQRERQAMLARTVDPPEPAINPRWAHLQALADRLAAEFGDTPEICAHRRLLLETSAAPARSSVQQVAA